MENGRTFGAVTELPCTCGSLERGGGNPDVPIVFDPVTGEYHIEYKGPDGKPRGCTVIYHCLFCGGTAPRSKRHLLFAVISAEEETRLAKMLAGVTTIEEALGRLGKPA